MTPHGERCGATMIGDEGERYTCGLARGHVYVHVDDSGCAQWRNDACPAGATGATCAEIILARGFAAVVCSVDKARAALGRIARAALGRTRRGERE